MMSSKYTLLALLAVMAVSSVVGTYKTGDPEIDFYISNPRLVRKYLDCVEKRSTGTCGVIGRRISRLIPEVLFNQCRNCSRDEAQKAQKIIQFIRTYYPYDYNYIWQLYSRQNY